MVKRISRKKKVAEEPIALDALMFESPHSESIRSASYDPVASVMTAHFQHGKSYDHDHFPLSLWREFEQAASKGRFYNERIRPMFAGILREKV